MCGITGIYHLNGSRKGISPDEGIKKMTDALAHRGPDASGYWTDLNTGIALGHRRLSIIDLSSNGDQPMTSSCGRYVIAYNGEIYNFHDIKNELELEKKSFRGYSDTEIILEACAYWGIETAISKFNGMFAFALWDKHKKCLYLARDRVGIKPLYWGRIGDLFLFASELKALRAYAGWKPEIDRNAIASYLRHNYIPTPQTIYKGIKKLEPGCILSVKYREEPQTESYWDMETVIKNASSYSYNREEKDTIDSTEELLIDAVKKRMIADVPLGVFLSGGIDSSLVTALMQKVSMKPIKTFSVGFHEKKFNEAHFAKEIAASLGTEHTEFYVTPNDAQDVIPMLPDIYDEPFSDSSQIPTYLISKLTREHVTVALSGDGGDEVFGGYSRYITADKYGKYLFGLPETIRTPFAQTIKSLSPNNWDKLNLLVPEKYRVTHLGNKAYKLADILKSGKNEYYSRLVSHWHHPEEIVMDAVEPPCMARKVLDTSGSIQDFIAQMQYMDTVSYLPDDILTKLDRASMAVSLEARVPLLDYRVVEHAWQLAMNMKVRNGQGKWILRNILSRYVPKHLFERPKRGFGVPIGDWLRGPLRDWAEGLLDENKMHQQGYLQSLPIRKKWVEHLSGKVNWDYHLWSVLMFQAWLERWEN